jgi:hypothetical protein
MRLLVLLFVLNSLLIPIGNAAMITFGATSFIESPSQNTVIETASDKRMLHCAEMLSDNNQCNMECTCAVFSNVTQLSSFDFAFPFLIQLEQPNGISSYPYSRTISPELRPPLI